MASIGDLEQELQFMPEPPDWKHEISLLKRPVHTLYFAYPCCGIVGSQPITSAMATVQAVNIFDLEEEYRELLTSTFANCPSVPTLHLGSAGDILGVPLNTLVCPDIVVAGPPCPPWAGNGNKKSCGDRRSDVFGQVLRWIVHFIHEGSLRACVLENVYGILMRYADKPSYMDSVVATLEKQVPAFFWKVRVLEAEEYGLAQVRRRVFLTGIRKTCSVAGVPEPLPPFGRKTLRDFLNLSLPNTDRSAIHPTKHANLSDIELKVRLAMANGEVPPGAIVCASIDTGLVFKLFSFATLE